MAIKKLFMNGVNMPSRELVFKKPMPISRTINEMVGSHTAAFSAAPDMPTMAIMIWKDRVKPILFGITIADIEDKIRDDNDAREGMEDDEIRGFAKDVACEILQDVIKREKPEALMIAADCFTGFIPNQRREWFIEEFDKDMYSNTKGPFNDEWAEVALNYVKHSVMTGWDHVPKDDESRKEALTFMIHRKNGDDTELHSIIMKYERSDEGHTIEFTGDNEDVKLDEDWEWHKVSDEKKSHGGRMVFTL